MISSTEKRVPGALLQQRALAQLLVIGQSSARQRAIQCLQDQDERLHSRVLSVLEVRAADDPFAKAKKMMKEGGQVPAAAVPQPGPAMVDNDLEALLAQAGLGSGQPAAVPAAAPQMPGAGSYDLNQLLGMAILQMMRKNGKGADPDDAGAGLDGLRIMKTMSRLRALRRRMVTKPKTITREYRQHWTHELDAEGERVGALRTPFGDGLLVDHAGSHERADGVDAGDGLRQACFVFTVDR